jgi:DNA (cytosine-5)-methyltransferase 3A
MMGERWQKTLTQAIGINPIEINSSLVSAQNRRRLYWTNIGAEQDGLFGDLACKIAQPKDKGILLKDVLEDEVEEKYYLSDKMLELLTFKDKGNGEVANVNKGGERGSVYDENYKMSTLCATDYKQPKQIICHNTMPRSSKTGKGGTGPLSRDDGKTYCLDTGRTNAIEVKHKYHDEIQKSLSNDKSTTLDASYYKGFGVRSGACRQVASNESRIRRLTPLECERLQCIKDNYTAHVSDSQRYKMIGNGWTIDVISYIFSYLKA